jgi:hypothetical protein
LPYFFSHTVQLLRKITTATARRTTVLPSSNIHETYVFSRNLKFDCKDHHVVPLRDAYFSIWCLFWVPLRSETQEIVGNRDDKDMTLITKRFVLYGYDSVRSTCSFVVLLLPVRFGVPQRWSFVIPEPLLVLQWDDAFYEDNHDNFVFCTIFYENDKYFFK